MTATLYSGQQYSAVVRVLNGSMQAGVAVPATLSVFMAGTVGTTTVLPDSSQDYSFGPNETHDFSFSFSIPTGTQGLSGNIYAALLDPAGNTIKDATLAITVGSTPLSYVSAVSISIQPHGSAANRKDAHFSVDVKNSDSVLATCSGTAIIRQSSGEVKAIMRPITINPGETIALTGFGMINSDAEWQEYTSIDSDAGLISIAYGLAFAVNSFSIAPSPVAAGGSVNWSIGLKLPYFPKKGFNVLLRIDGRNNIGGFRVGPSDWTFYSTKDYIIPGAGSYVFSALEVLPSTVIPGVHNVTINLDVLDNVGNAQYAFYKGKVGQIEVI